MPDYDPSEEVDAEELALGRWPSLLRALKMALIKGSVRRILMMCVNVEYVLGMRALMTSDEQIPRQPSEIIELLEGFEAEHPDLLGRLTLALERALATSPFWWVSYVRLVGRANFDPVELGACAGIARAHAGSPQEHQEITAIIHHCWSMLLGQWPVPEVRALPQRGDPTLLARIITATEQVQLNWRSLGLRPVVNQDLAVRWIDHAKWVAWVRLANTLDGKINGHAVLRLQSDGLFRLVRS